jgi:hypothetical protein
VSGLRPIQRLIGSAACVAAVATLAACTASGKAESPAFCRQDPYARAFQVDPSDEMMRLFNDVGSCVYLNARNLSVGPDGAEPVADAVLTVCRGPLSAFASYQRKRALAAGETESEPNTFEKGGDMYWRRQARAYVIQSRASHCPRGPD